MSELKIPEDLNRGEPAPLTDRDMEDLRCYGCEARDEEIARLTKEKLDLTLLANSAETYWDGDVEYDDPNEYARESDLRVGDEYDLTAASYWPARFRVTKVSEDQGDLKVENITKPRGAEFTSYQDLFAQNLALKARAEAAEAALLVWESAGILAIKAADKMADVCDDWVKRGLLDARSALADARLIYGDPYFPVLPKILEEAARFAAAQKGGTQ